MNGGDFADEPPVKRRAMDAVKLKIGTHNGSFHCDEALACYMLKCLPKYKVRMFDKLTETILKIDRPVKLEISSI